ncbi:hypothetical protein D3C84_1012040 [compost metagenome]
MPAANHQQLVGGRCLQGCEAHQISENRGRCGLDALTGSLQAGRQVRLERAQIDAMGIIEQSRQRQFVL